MNDGSKMRVIHVRDWDHSDPNAIYIGRTAPRSHLKASKYANPYVIGQQGMNREEVVWRYDMWVRGKLHDMTLGRAKWIREHLQDLDGKTLVCWCSPKLCHGDALIRLVREVREGRSIT